MQSAPAAIGNPQVRIKSESGVKVFKGTDRVVIARVDSGETGVKVDLPILPSIGTRCGKIAEDWQKWQLRSMNFRVTGPNPSIARGSYVHGMLKDPSESVNAEVVDRLMASGTGQSQKIWGNSNAMWKAVKSWLFTSPGDDLRLAAAGRYVLFVDVAPDSPCDLVINVDWEIACKDPSIEPSLTAGSQTSVTAESALLFSQGVGTDAQGPTATWTTGEPSAIAALPDGTALRLPYPVTVIDNTNKTAYRVTALKLRPFGVSDVRNELGSIGTDGKYKPLKDGSLRSIDWSLPEASDVTSGVDPPIAAPEYLEITPYGERFSFLVLEESDDDPDFRKRALLRLKSALAPKLNCVGGMTVLTRGGKRF